MTFLTLILLAQAAPPALGHGKIPPRSGPALRNLLKSGSLQAQIIAWRQDVEEHPDSEIAHMNLGKALAKIGDCNSALDELWPLSDALNFGKEGATAAAICSARLGLYADAVAFDQRVIEEDPESIHAYTLLALHADRLGDVSTVDDALNTLDRLGTKGGDPTLYTRAVLALRQGNLDEFDIDCALWVRSGWGTRELRRLEVQVWLDLDDPQSAWNLIEGKILSIQSGRHLFLEAQRRLGEANTIFTSLETHTRVASGIGADALKIRSYVDLGQFKEAHTLLNTYAGSSDPDIVASRWYVAQAEGNAAEATTFAIEWNHVHESPLSRLDQLLPINRR